MLIESLALRQAQFGRSHPASADSLLRLSTVRIGQQRCGEAVLLSREALATTPPVPTGAPRAHSHGGARPGASSHSLRRSRRSATSGARSAAHSNGTDGPGSVANPRGEQVHGAEPRSLSDNSVVGSSNRYQSRRRCFGGVMPNGEAGALVSWQPGESAPALEERQRVLQCNPELSITQDRLYRPFQALLGPGKINHYAAASPTRHTTASTVPRLSWSSPAIRL